MAAQLLTKSEYAKHRGVSAGMVSHWTNAGRIVILDGKVAVEASDAMLARSMDPARGGKGGKSGRPAPSENATAGQPQTNAGAADEPAAPDAPFVDPDSFQAARARREGFAAKTAEIDYRKAVGELVEWDRTEKAVAGICSTLRRALQRMPDALSARLAAEPDPRKVRAMLTKDLEQALADMADAVAALPEQLTATQQ